MMNDLQVPTDTQMLDVRQTPPKHRFETIMSTYRGLSPGQTLELVVDHDPTCMYYTLKAEYGDDFFSFQYLERGPETWRIHVTRERA